MVFFKKYPVLENTVNFWWPLIMIHTIHGELIMKIKLLKLIRMDMCIGKIIIGFGELY